MECWSSGVLSDGIVAHCIFQAELELEGRCDQHHAEQHSNAPLLHYSNTPLLRFRLPFRGASG